MLKTSLADKAAALTAKTHELEESRMVDRGEALDPKTGTSLYLFRVVSWTNANKPAHVVILNDRGGAVEASRATESLFDHTVLTTGPMGGARPAAVTITVQPDTNIFILNPGETVDEMTRVTIPKNARPAKADVYFLADTTASITSILNAVHAGANNVLATLNGFGADIVLGVGDCKDLASDDPFCFQHQVSPTNVHAAIAATINIWSASGGRDIPEDAPGYDPICTAVASPITESSATAGITGLASSTANPGRDDDPKAGAAGYVAQCGTPGGLPGQGTRIATSTHSGDEQIVRADGLAMSLQVGATLDANRVSFNCGQSRMYRKQQPFTADVEQT